MKHFIDYFLVEASTKAKILEAPIVIRAVKTQDGEIIPTDKIVRVAINLDPDTDYAKTKFTQKEFLVKAFESLLTDKQVQKFMKSVGTDAIPYAFSITGKIAQNNKKKGLNNNELSELIGKNSQKRKTNRTYPAITNLVDENRIYFLDTDKYFDNNNDIVVYQSTNGKGKQLEKELTKLTQDIDNDEDAADNPVDDTTASDTAEEPESDTTNTSNSVETNTEENPETANDETNTIDNTEKEDTPEEKPEDPKPQVNKSISFIVAVSEVISADGKVSISTNTIEKSLTMRLNDNVETVNYANNIYNAITQNIVTTYINEVKDKSIPLTITIDEVEYNNLTSKEQANMEKYIADNTIVYNSDNEIGKFNDDTCMLISTTRGKEYYNKKINSQDTKKQNSLFAKLRNKLFSKKPDDKQDAGIKYNATPTSDDVYTDKDTKLALKVLTSLGIDYDKAKVVIDKVINK